jgi:hypothetical protein
MPQVWGKIKIPAGKKIAVNLGCDFDAQSLWICLNRTSPAYMSRGEFSAEVGLPRLMRLFDKYKVKSTFCIPGHTSTPGPSCAARSRPQDTRLGITATPMKTLSH